VVGTRICHEYSQHVRVGEFRGMNFQKESPAIRQQKFTRGKFRFEKNSSAIQQTIYQGVNPGIGYNIEDPVTGRIPGTIYHLPETGAGKSFLYPLLQPVE